MQPDGGIRISGADPTSVEALPPRVTDVALDEPNLNDGRPTFVERKRTDPGRLAQILELSGRVNRWANFGPVSEALEWRLGDLLDLPPSRSVVMTSSGTAALIALVGIQVAKAGRPLRWLTSAYGFAATTIGPLATCTRVVDCDHDGMLDLNIVAEMDDREWDGLLITNLFGQHASLGAYQEFCRARGKCLLVDNATALLGVERRNDPVDEIISFHHTKPWGMGEGGCLILDRDDAVLARRLLSFGLGAPNVAMPFAANGKISEYGCALILERLERLPVWSELYRSQYQRIRALGIQVGLEPFGDIAPGGVTGNVPMLMPSARFPRDVAPTVIPLTKYYAPLSNAPKAAQLYGQMVNIASHPGMAALDDSLILDALRPLSAASTPIANH